VRQLLDIVRKQQEHIDRLEEEIARLKALKGRPVISSAAGIRSHRRRS
jgi:hypothetical protein